MESGAGKNSQLRINRLLFLWVFARRNGHDAGILHVLEYEVERMVLKGNPRF